jgi:hypothetical protein
MASQADIAAAKKRLGVPVADAVAGAPEVPYIGEYSQPVDAVTQDFYARHPEQLADPNTPPPEPEPKVRDAYNVPGQNELGTNALVNSMGSMDTNTSLVNSLMGPQGGGAGKDIVPEATNWTRVGGRQVPNQLADASEQQQGAVQSKGVDESQVEQQMAGVYGQARKDIEKYTGSAMAQDQRDVDAYRMRMAQIDQKASQIAAHQYDAGRFWNSPQGLFATMGAAMAVMASTDPTIGIKLINQYIDREARQQQAEHENMQADLLGLRTNTAEYRQLMGSKQAGDALHVAKMKEMAAMQLEELSHQLKSKDAISNANLITGKLREEAAMIYSGLAQKAYTAPQAVPGGMGKYYLQGEADTYGPKKPTAPAVAAPSAPGTAATGVAPTKGAASIGAAAGRVANTVINSGEARAEAGLNQKAKSFEERTAIPASVYKAYYPKLLNQLNALVTAKSGGDPKKRGPAIAEIMKDNTDNMSKHIEPWSKAVADGSTLRGLQEKIQLLKHDPAFNKNGQVDYDGIDKALSTGINRLMMMPPEAIRVEMRSAMRDAVLSGAVSGELAEKRIQATINWIQQVQMAATEYGHQKFGAALTGNPGDPDTEKANLKRVISSWDNFATVENFTRTESKAIGDRMNALFSTMSPLTKLNILENYGTAQPAMPTQGRAGK